MPRVYEGGKVQAGLLSLCAGLKGNAELAKEGWELMGPQYWRMAVTAASLGRDFYRLHYNSKRIRLGIYDGRKKSGLEKL